MDTPCTSRKATSKATPKSAPIVGLFRVLLWGPTRANPCPPAHPRGALGGADPASNRTRSPKCCRGGAVRPCPSPRGHFSHDFPTRKLLRPRAILSLGAPPAFCAPPCFAHRVTHTHLNRHTAETTLTPPSSQVRPVSSSPPQVARAATARPCAFVARDVFKGRHERQPPV